MSGTYLGYRFIVSFLNTQEHGRPTYELTITAHVPTFASAVGKCQKGGTYIDSKTLFGAVLSTVPIAT